MDPDGRTRCFQSTSGFRMWGGEQRPPAQPVPFAWISLGLVVGLAIVSPIMSSINKGLEEAKTLEAIDLACADLAGRLGMGQPAAARRY